MTKINKKKSKITLIALILGFLCFAGVVLAATILEDDFNSYNDGDLNGQGSWAGNTVFDVQGILVYEGAKGIKAIGTAANQLIAKTGSQLSEGRITIYHRRTTLGGSVADYSFPFRLYEDTTICTGVGFGINNSTSIDLMTDSVWVDTGYNFAVDTWYEIEVEWREDAGNPQTRMRVDGGAWYGWYDTYQDWVTGLNKVELRLNGDATAYWDYIAENPYAVPSGRRRFIIFHNN